MNKYEMASELIDIIECVEKDKSLWARVAGLDGARFEIRFCCNSGTLRRVRVLQHGPAAVFVSNKLESDMPTELVLIRDKCKNDKGFLSRVLPFSAGKMDIVFKCAGQAVWDVLIQEVS